MIEKSDRKELERRLEQAKRAAALATTPSPQTAYRSWSKSWKSSFGCRSSRARAFLFQVTRRIISPSPSAGPPNVASLGLSVTGAFNVKS